MTQQQWRDLVHSQIDIDTADGQMMNCLARLPDLMERGRRALRSPSLPSPLSDIQKELRSLRDYFGPHLKSLRERWTDTDSSIATQYPDFLQQKGIIHAHFSRSYGMALAAGIIFNCILAAVGGSSAELSQETSQLSDEVVTLAGVVDQYRPLGTIYMILCLAAAWAGATDPTKKAIVGTHLLSYQRDIKGPSATLDSAELAFIEARFYLK